ncbi:MAG: Abi family protein, partial [Bacteroidota bacterium]|nr:Abi family protein [Bacteroidota bacterium]
MQFNKSAKTIEEQITLLRSRGLIIPDEIKARQYLSNISYYRLSSYMLPFQRYNDQKHSFMPNTSFDNILNLYVFDRQLRLLIFDEIERIEIAFRCQIIYKYSLSGGNNWYEEIGYFYNAFHFNKFQVQVNSELSLSKEVFIQHYKTKYSSPVNPPAWMSLEILSFGQLSKMFKNLRTSAQKKEIGNHFSIHHEVLNSWVESLTYVRNLCAHHSRIWN